MGAELIIAGLAGAYFLTRPRTIGTLPADAASAGGVQPGLSPGVPGGGNGLNLPNYPTGNATLDSALGAEQKVDAAVVNGVCSYYARGAPVCRSIGGAIAKVNTLQTQLTIRGAKFVAKEAYAGGKAIGSAAYSVAKDPSVAGFAVTDRSLSLTSKASTSLDRLTTSAYGKLPTPVKLAVAPAYAVAKVSNQVVQASVKVGGALESGAKSVGSATKSVVNKVLGWL